MLAGEPGFSCNSLAFAGWRGELYIKKEGCPNDFLRIAEILTMSLTASRDMIDVTTYLNEGWRSFEPGFKSWSSSHSEIYVQTDEGQKEIESAIFLGKRIYLKFVPTRNFDQIGTRREIFVGLCFVTSWSITSPLGAPGRVTVSMRGVGELMQRLETETQADELCDFCCEPLNETIYLVLDEEFVAPPAPPGSTGWVVEKNFEPEETGTGDIGTITINPSGAGLDGCPVQVTYRYLCEDGPYIPTGGGTTLDDFVEIAENTSNSGQIAIINIMEEQVGFRIGDPKGVNQLFKAQDLYIEFNFVFLVANPTFLLDVSGLGIDDITIINQLSNLQRLDASFNNLTVFNLDELTIPALIFLNVSHNLVGQDNGELAQQAPTLTHLDMSFNFLNESFVFMSAGGPDVDLYDLSNNYLGFIDNSARRIKTFKMVFNTYPSPVVLDPSAPADFWSIRITNVLSSVRIIDGGVTNMMLDYTVVDLVDISESQLADETVDIQTLITRIEVAQGITNAEAALKVKYNPTYSDTVSSRSVYNRLSLPRDSKP